MTSLHVRPRPADADGCVIDITPESAGWSYVGFSVFHLEPGQTVTRRAENREVLLVLVEGSAKLAAAGRDYGELGDRTSVFQRLKPFALYVGAGMDWSAEAATRVTLAACSAPAEGTYEPRLIIPDDIGLDVRGKDTNERTIHPIMMEDQDWAERLLVTEVFTPAGHWSSYPPHRHDEDDFPNQTYLEETYYHRLDPPQGYAHHRIYTDRRDDGMRDLDQTVTVSDGDVTLVPRGYHPVGAPYGYDLYYLNVMAGPLRKWRFRNDPDHDWIVQRDSAA